MGKKDFHIVSEAVLLYSQNGNSLFADYIISEKLNLSTEAVREKIRNWYHVSPEELVKHLEPERIKKRIVKTTLEMKQCFHNPSFIQIEPMTEEELKQGGEMLSVRFQFAETIFGKVIIASTSKGVCYLAFSEDGNQVSFDRLQSRFPGATMQEATDDFQKAALSAIGKSDHFDTTINPHCS